MQTEELQVCGFAMQTQELQVCSQPFVLKDGGELTTEQQDFLRHKYTVKCTTRPLRAGRAKEYTEQEQQQQQQQQWCSCGSPWQSEAFHISGGGRRDVLYLQ